MPKSPILGLSLLCIFAFLALLSTGESIIDGRVQVSKMDNESAVEPGEDSQFNRYDRRLKDARRAIDDWERRREQFLAEIRNRPPLPRPTLQRVLDGHARCRLSIAVTPDGRQLASAGRDGTIRIWNLANGKPLRVYRDAESRFNSIRYLRDGKRLVVGKDEGEVLIWNPDKSMSPRLLKPAGRTNSIYVVDLAVSNDGEWLAAAQHGSIQVWRRLEPYETRIKEFEYGAFSIAFAPGRPNILAIGDFSGTVEVWNLRQQKRLASLFDWSDSGTRIAFSRDGKLIAVANSERRHAFGQVNIYEVGSFKRLATVLHQHRIRAIRFDVKANRLLAGDSYGNLIVWDIALAQCMPGFDRRRNANIAYVSRIRTDGRLKAVFNAHADQISEIGLAVDGKVVATAGDDGKIKIWSLQEVRGR